MIGNGVINIGEDAFGRCSSLITIDVAADNTAYSADDGVLYNKDKTTLIQWPGGKTGSIPNGITTIASYAFNGCMGITSVTIPVSVTSIGDFAFLNCSNLTSVTIPSNVTFIGARAFADLSNLTSVMFEGTIPSANLGFYWDGYTYTYYNPFPGDLRDKYLAEGAGTYSRPSGGSTWTKE
jgi:hypothetical protein